jgi:hypothetical protein
MKPVKGVNFELSRMGYKIVFAKQIARTIIVQVVGMQNA